MFTRLSVQEKVPLAKDVEPIVNDAKTAADSESHNFSWVYQHLVQLQQKEGCNAKAASRDLAQFNQDLHKQGILPSCDVVDSDKQTRKEERLRTSGQTDNLLNTGFHVEGEGAAVDVDQKTRPGELKVRLNRPIRDGEQVAVVQPIDYQFRPVTPEQQQWQLEHPNGPELGHIVHVQFKAKSGDGDQSDHKMIVQLMDSKAPYNQSMSERVDLAKAGHKDSDGYSTYDFYAVAPDSKGDGRLNLKFNFGQPQEKSKFDIKDISVKEVSSAPGLNPADVVKAGSNDPNGAKQYDRSTFMLGANANQLAQQNVSVPPELKEKAQEAYPNDVKMQEKMIDEYQRDHALTPEQEEKYLQRMKEMGINCVTIPIYWNQIENEPGKMDYEKVDHMIDMAKRYGMDVKLHPIVWADSYPAWADKTGKPTQEVVGEHVDDIIKHFGRKVDYIEVNELNSTDQLRHQNSAKTGETEQVDNGLTRWVQSDGAAAVINQVDKRIRDDLAKYGSNAKLLENEYVINQKTLSNDAHVSQDPNRPDALGIQMHQFNGNYPALRIARELQERGQNAMPTYVSEITVQTNNTKKVNEAALSPQVQDAVKQEEQYRKDKHLQPLSEQDRWAQETQAEQLLTMYRLTMANKNTVGISLWDFSDKNAWNGNTGGVLDTNLDPKISYFALQRFIGKYDQTR